MSHELRQYGGEDNGHSIQHNTAAPPVVIPPGYVGPVVLPGNGRMVWWTGRVAIGLRHQPERHEMIGESALWLQRLMLRKGHRTMAA
jgi:hypothetical protein